MKLKDTNIKSIINTLILKNISCILWYVMAIITFAFLINDITKTKVTVLIIVLIVIYFIREFINLLYVKVANKNYQTIKHSVEMYYFNNLKLVHNSRIEQIDKEYLANKILEVAYNITKFISDIGENIIPAFIGILFLLYLLASYSIFVALISIVLLILTIIVSYKRIEDEEDTSLSNYNDLLKDYVLKIKTIRKLNAFQFCTKKLDSYCDNNLVVIKNSDTINHVKFNTLMSVISSVLVVLLLIFVNSTINKLVIISCTLAIMFKLQGLLFNIAPAIKNAKKLCQNKDILDSFFVELYEFNYINDFKKVQIINGKVTYTDVDVTISIPNFELIKGDTVSIMGKASEGKTTVLNILSGITKLNEGEIIFDGTSKNKIVDAVHITKDTEMFRLSLRDNLRLWQKSSDEEILGLIKEIGLTDFYESLPNGLDTIIDENYIKLSINQKQKLNLIRAILVNKNLYFFDDPTFDLSIDEETKVANMIKKYFKNATVIIVSARPVLTTICKKHYFVKNHTLLEKEPLL